MSTQPDAPRRPPTAARVLHWLRRGVLLYAALGALYLGWRFEVQTLPRAGVSPLLAFRPGAHLLIDLRRLEARPGEALLFRDDAGRLLLARLAQKPAAEQRAGLWLLADDAPTQQLPDSRSLGPIAPERRAHRPGGPRPLRTPGRAQGSDGGLRPRWGLPN